MRQLNVLLFDIETAPMTVYAWGRRDVNIALNQIKKDWHLLAFAAKWLGDPPSKIIYHDQRKQKHVENDKQLLQEIWKLLDRADVVITHNGKRFDSRKLNARFILNGMKPPRPYKHFDTLLLAKSVGDFTSISLEYLTDKLCTKYKKLKHNKFPGMALWNACLDGNKKVWKEMQKYNIHDVLSLEEFYYKIRAWAPENMPAIYPGGNVLDHCGTCGSRRVYKEGYAYCRTSRAAQISCRDCGKWSFGKREKL